jgi:cyclic beta-1,2-glucan synthetase
VPTRYTRSAKWMYRLLVESLPGLRVEGDTLRIARCLPVREPLVHLVDNRQDHRIAVTIHRSRDANRGEA